MRKIILFCSLLFLSGCSNDKLTVSVASSLTDAMTEICENYEDVSLNFGGSGMLKIQIENGADVDIFISADTSHKTSESEILLSNKLVLISNNPENTFDDFLANQDILIGIGNPETVPAGRYASEIIALYELKHQTNLATEVRQVLSWVAQGEIEYGFVYKTDAMTEENVHIIKVFDECSEIFYPMIMLNENEETKEFANFILENKHVFEKYGFTVEN